MEYILLKESNQVLLSREVNYHLKRGWELHGSPFFSRQNNFNSSFLQAMVKRETNYSVEQ